MTAEHNDEDDPELFPMICHKTIMEQVGPIKYAKVGDKSRARCLMKLIDNDGQEQICWTTYYVNGRAQVGGCICQWAGGVYRKIDGGLWGVGEEDSSYS